MDVEGIPSEIYTHTAFNGYPSTLEGEANRKRTTGPMGRNGLYNIHVPVVNLLDFSWRLLNLDV